MDNLTLIILVIVAFVQIIMIITFFVIASNISSIKKKLIPSGDYFISKFYSLVLSGEKDIAKKLLYDHISKESCFISVASFPEQYLIDSASKELETKYEKELKLLGMQSFDLDKLKDYK